jgi:hypothetical protein
MRLESTSPQQQYYKLFDGEVKLYAKNATKLYNSFTESVNTNNIDYRLTTLAPFGSAPQVTPGDAYPVRDYSNPFQRTYTIIRSGIAFEVDYAVFMSDVYKDAAEARGPLLAKSIEQAREYYFSNFLNLATAGTTTNGIISPDGITLASASHTLANGVASNIVTGNPALSYAALRTARAQMYNTVDHLGDPDTIQGPFMLLVHPDNLDLALRLTETQQLPGTADNDKNIAGQSITVLTSPYFTSTTAFALIAQNENPLLRIEKHGIRTKMSDAAEARDGSTLYSASAMYGAACKDWRGFIYSSGLGV